MSAVRIVIEGDIAEITDGTGRLAFVCIVGGGHAKWGVSCTGDPKCNVRIFGYTRQHQAIRGGEWHLKWHRNGEPRCTDCGADLGRKGATHCPPGRCEAES